VTTRPGPIQVAPDRERIANSPLARLLVASVVVDESSPRAENGRRLARAGAVADLDVQLGTITAAVTGDSGTAYRIDLRAEPVPPRVWAAVAGSGAGRQLIEAALSGRARSVQLEHMMTVDWEEPLVPHARAIKRSCTCPDWDRHGQACKHISALGYALAHLLDSDASVLFEWRGCDPRVGTVRPAPEPAPVDDTPPPDDVWDVGALPTIGPARPLPIGAVVKRLGRSGIKAGTEDLSVVLERAYAAFAAVD
jgi:SWIM zinc finger